MILLLPQQRRRTESPMPAHQPDRDLFPISTSETGVPNGMRLYLPREISRSRGVAAGKTSRHL